MKPKLQPHLEPYGAHELQDGDEIRHSILEDHVFSGQQARGISLDGCRLKRVDLSSVKLRVASWSDLVLDDCMLFGADIDGIGIRRLEFNNCIMSGTVFSAGALEDVTFTNCKLNMANFRLADIKNIKFIDCVMTEADFYGAKLTKASFAGCNLEKAIFAQSKLRDVDLRGAEVQGIRGTASMKGSRISSTQLVVLAANIVREAGIEVVD